MNKYTKNYIENISKDNDLFFVKIGHDEDIINDDLHKYIKSNQMSGVLVEPSKDIFEKLKNVYKENYRIFFENSDKISLNSLINKYDINIIDIIQISKDNSYDILKELDMKIYRPYLIIMSIANINKDTHSKIVSIFEGHNYIYFKENDERIIAFREPEKFINSFDDFLYKIIWNYYQNERWNILIKYCYIYASRFENKDVNKTNLIDDHKYHHSLFFMGYAYAKIGENAAAKIIYEELLTIKDLNENVREWTNYNISLLTN